MATYKSIQKVTREREIWSRMEHPNIVPLCGYTEESELFGPFGALVSPVSCTRSSQSPVLRGSVVSKWRFCSFSQQAWRIIDNGGAYCNGDYSVIIHLTLS